MTTTRSAPIGVFDSGVGGLAVLVELRHLMPGEDVVYYADSAHFPYGPKRYDDVRARAEAVTRELLSRGAKLIVVACNTATSAAIAHLRATFDAPFAGMEPALKPAAAITRSGRVALLVTPGTAEGTKLAGLIGQHGADVRVDVIPAPGLAEAVEAGALDGESTRALVRRFVAPVRASGADVLALGCTHYAFVRGHIEVEAGEGVTVVEPSEAVARQAARLLDSRGLNRGGAAGGRTVYLTSGDAGAFAAQRERLREAGAAIPF